MLQFQITVTGISLSSLKGLLQRSSGLELLGTTKQEKYSWVGTCLYQLLQCEAGEAIFT